MMPPRTADCVASARAALATYAVLGTPPEPQFDVFPALALTALGAESALLAFFDGDRMWIKGGAGLLDVDARLAGERLAHTFELGQANAVADDANFYCGAPVFTIDGHAVGSIGVFGRRPHSAVPAPLPVLEAIAEAVTHALEARKRSSGGDVPRTRALVAFDPAEWRVVFADSESVRHYGATPATMQRLTIDDIFRNVDPAARRELEHLRDAAHGRTFAFTARALGAVGFWNAVACDARTIRDKHARSLVIVEYSDPERASVRPTLRAIAPAPADSEEHRIETVLSKIEAGRRILRGESAEKGATLTKEGFVSAVVGLLSESTERHLLIVLALGPHSAADVLAQARRARLVCDLDLAVAIGDGRLAILLRNLPVAIGRQAIKRFARPLLGATFVICDVQGPNADVQRLLDATLAGLERE